MSRKIASDGTVFDHDYDEYGFDHQQISLRQHEEKLVSDAAAQDRKDTFRQVDETGTLGAFGSQGLQNYANNTVKMDALGKILEGRASGQDSLSAEQLRHALGQTLSAQRSASASARPANQAMAARTAAIQMGRQTSGLAGAQAMAGIEERSAAQRDLGQLLSTQRGQDIQAGLGGAGAVEGARTSRYGIDSSQPEKKSFLDKVLGAAGTAAQIYSSI